MKSKTFDEERIGKYTIQSDEQIDVWEEAKNGNQTVQSWSKSEIEKSIAKLQIETDDKQEERTQDMQEKCHVPAEV